MAKFHELPSLSPILANTHLHLEAYNKNLEIMTQRIGWPSPLAKRDGFLHLNVFEHFVVLGILHHQIIFLLLQIWTCHLCV